MACKLSLFLCIALVIVATAFAHHDQQHEEHNQHKHEHELQRRFAGLEDIHMKDILKKLMVVFYKLYENPKAVATLVSIVQTIIILSNPALLGGPALMKNLYTLYTLAIALYGMIKQGSNTATEAPVEDITTSRPLPDLTTIADIFNTTPFPENDDSNDVNSTPYPEESDDNDANPEEDDDLEMETEEYDQQTEAPHSGQTESNDVPSSNTKRPESITTASPSGRRFFSFAHLREHMPSNPFGKRAISDSSFYNMMPQGLKDLVNGAGKRPSETISNAKNTLGKLSGEASRYASDAAKVPSRVLSEAQSSLGKLTGSGQSSLVGRLGDAVQGAKKVVGGAASSAFGRVNDAAQGVYGSAQRVSHESLHQMMHLLQHGHMHPSAMINAAVPAYG